MRHSPILAAALVALPLAAAAHGPHFSPEEVAWMDRQHALDGMKCCDERDVTIGLAVRWRMQGRHYEVLIGGRWWQVPPGRMLRHNTADPSPFPGEAILFYSPMPDGTPRIWCFSPPPLT